jgi:sugar lactone lactonase YvrE
MPFLTAFAVNAQCVFVSVTGPRCASDGNLVATFSRSPFMVEWKLGNTVAQKQTASWTNFATPVVSGTYNSAPTTNRITGSAGVWVDNAGEIYVADTINHRVVAFSRTFPDGRTIAGGNGNGNGNNQLSKPAGLCMDAFGNLFVVDVNNNRVLRFAPGSTVGFPVAGGNGNGSSANQLSNPRDVWVDANGFVYIADAGNHRIQKWAQGATAGQTIAGGFPGSDSASLNSPQGVFVDQQFNVYVADSGNHRIQKFTPNNFYGKTVAGGNGKGAYAVQLDKPVDVWVDAVGEIYVLDAGNSRVQKWTANSLYVTTIAGSSAGIAGGFNDQYNIPSAMAFDPSGNLFVLDEKNLRVQNSPTVQVTNTYAAQFQGNYNAVAYSFTGCKQNSNTIFVNANAPITITGNTIICRGDTATLKVTGTSNFSWLPATGVIKVNDSTYRIKADSSTYYGVTSRNDSGCTSFSSVGIQVSDRIFPFVTATDCADSNASKLTAKLTGAMPAHLLWYTGTNTVKSVFPSWMQTASTSIGGNGTGNSNAQFNLPSGMFIDDKGNVYVADAVNHRIQLWKPGELTGRTVVGGNGAGDGRDQLNYPTGVFVDVQGNIYVADQNNHRVQFFPVGTTQANTVAGIGIAGNSSFQLNFPNSVFVDAFGNVYVADAGNNRIQKWTAGARSVTTVAGNGTPGNGLNQLNNPQHVFVDRFTNLYVSDAGNHRVIFYPKDSTFGFIMAGGKGAGTLQNQLNAPSQVWVDAVGTIYISDRGNNRIQRWKSFDSTGITVAGNPEGNAGSLLSQLNLPGSIAFNSKGNLYVADTRNHRILQFTPTTFNDTTYATGKNGVYTALASSFNGCSTGSQFVTLNTAKKITLNAQNTIFCEGGATSITASGGDNYTWLPAQGLSATNTASVVARPTISTRYTVSSTATNGCKSTASISLTINKVPQVEVTGLNCLGTGKLGISSNPKPVLVNWNLPNGGTVSLPASWNKRATIVAGSTIAGFDSSKFARPIFVFVDVKGDLYVSDQWNNRVQKWKQGATSGTTVAGGRGAGAGASQLKNPSGIYVDSRGMIYIADTDNDRIQRWAPGDTVGITVAGGNGRGNAANQFTYPTSVYLDAYDNMYVADALNARIQKWEPGALNGTTVAGGNFAGSAANQLNTPLGVCVDKAGNLYIADTQNDRVQQWIVGATTGTTVAGGKGKGNNLDQLVLPQHISIDGGGTLYIAEGGTVNRVKKWIPGSNEGEVIAGGVSAGAGTELLNTPSNAMVDENGNLFVADMNNFRVQRFSLVDSVHSITPNTVGNYNAMILSFGSCMVMSPSINMNIGAIPNDPIVADKKYCINERSTPLTAGPGKLLWYTNASGGIGDSIAPTPQTSVVGTTNYWVAQVNNAGTCESKRLKIGVTINSLPGARLQALNKLTILPGDTSFLRAQADSGKTFSKAFWYKNGTLLSNVIDTTKTFKVFYNATGKFYVELADSNLCVSKSNEVEVVASLVSGQAMYLFPNPVKTSTKIIYSALSTNVVYLKVFSTSGLELINKKIPSAVTGINNTYDLDLSLLPPGTYEVQLITGVGKLIGSRRIFKL